MRDVLGQWPAEPDRADGSIQARDFQARSLTGVWQYLVSGNRDAWTGQTNIRIGPPESAGQNYAVSVARDRILAVTSQPLLCEPGWHRAGFAVADMSGGLHLLELSGKRLPGILARATTLRDLRTARSAALLFAGVSMIAYPAGADTIRLHVDRSLTAYVWLWLRTTLDLSSR